MGKTEGTNPYRLEEKIRKTRLDAKVKSGKVNKKTELDWQENKTGTVTEIRKRGDRG